MSTPAASAADPVFEQVGSYRLYALSTREQAAAAGYWAGYLPGSTASLPPTASLDEVWQDTGGVYLFCSADPTGDPEAFLAGLARVLSAGVRFLWIAGPTAPPETWTTFRLAAQAQGSGPGVSWRVSRQARFPLGAYSVEIDQGTVLTRSDPAVRGAGVDVGAEGFALVTPGAVYSADGGAAWLPLAGPGLGGWGADLALRAGESSEPDGFARLGVQLRYAMVDPDDPDRASVRIVPMPILRQGRVELTGTVSFDPLHPLLPARTSISLLPPAGDGGDRASAAGPVLDCGLRTTLGYPVQLTPVHGQAPLWPARFVFCYSPVYVDPSDGYRDYYLAPDGTFALTSPPQPGDNPDRRLLLGVSGGEYAQLPDDGSATVLFQAGKSAFSAAAGADRAEAGAAAADSPLFTDAATTAYLSILPPTAGPTGLTYYAQPQHSPWYSAAEGAEPGFLDSRPLPAAELPALPTPQSSDKEPPTALPVGAYAGMDSAQSRAAQLLEETSLAPARRRAIGVVESREPEAGGGPEAAGPRAVETIRVVTPQGVVADVAAGSTVRDTEWLRMVIASFPGAPVPELAFTGVGPRLRAALQTSELFFAVTDVTEFMQQSSVRYGLDQLALELLAGQDVPEAVITLLRPLIGRVYENEDDFTAALPAPAAPYQEKILAAAGLLKAAVEGWTFQLSPRSWRTEPGSRTIMLVKYAARSLADLAAQPGAWGWPQAAGDAEATRKEVLDLFEAAEQAPAGSPYRRFWSEVAADPAWNGVLFLNAPVSVAELPADLQFVTAGIDPDRFYAHHVGFSLTPVDAAGGGIRLGQTAAFGLLHYEDLADLVLDSTVPFAFKTQRLSIRFAGGVIADLSAQVELMVNRLFGGVLSMQDPDHGNNLVLAGAYQRQNGVPTYTFALTRRCRFETAGSVLRSVEVAGVGLQTAAGSVAAGTVAVDFALSGSLRFAELPNFDLFSYGPQDGAPPGDDPADGYLRYSGLVVRMEFPVATPRAQTFRIDEGRVAIDPAASAARSGSLAAGFPVKVTGLVASPNTAPEGEKAAGLKPEDLGYTSILAPLDQSRLEPPWYGLAMSLDLGTLGALAGSAGVTAGLLAAWAPGAYPEERPVFLGLKLSGGPAAGSGWPVQGVLRLGFRSFEFLAVEQDGRREYLLLLRHLALSLLGWSLPPGSIDMMLFGDPDAQRATSLGWYAAYDGRPPGSAAAGPPGSGTSGRPADPALRRLRSGRRELPPGSNLRATPAHDGRRGLR